MCWQDGSVHCLMKHLDLVGQLNTRTASQAAFFFKHTEAIQDFEMCPQTSCTLLKKHIQPPPFQTHSCITLKIDTGIWEGTCGLSSCLDFR